MSIKFLAALVSVCVLGTAVGCGGSSNNNGGERGVSSCSDIAVPEGSVNAAIIQTVSPYFDASAIEIVDMSVNASSYMAEGSINESAESDFSVIANGNSFYQLGRSNIDTLTRWMIADTAAPLWQFSTKDAGASSNNPYDLVFENESQGYLIAYASNSVWQVNLKASSAACLKQSVLDISAYADADGYPEASAGVVVDGYLYVLMQRLENYAPTNISYIAVFDVSDNTEIDAGIDATFKGIPLQTRNADNITYVDGVGLIIASTGNWATDEFTGIEVIDLDDYTTTVLIDDADGYGNTTSVAIVDATSGYFVGYAGWQNTSLYFFNPTTGAVDANSVSGLGGVDIRALAVDPNGLVWVGLADDSDPRIVIIDPVDDSIVKTVRTNMNPTAIVFTTN